MPVSPVVCPKEPLSRDLDVSVSISRPITEIATDMTMICFVTPDVEFSAGNGRVQFFSTMKALSAAVPANSAGTPSSPETTARRRWRWGASSPSLWPPS